MLQNNSIQRKLLTNLCFISVFALVLSAFATPVGLLYAQVAGPVTLTITRFDWRNDPDDFLEGPPRFYAKVKINGVELGSLPVSC
jgi:hypothetical protein